MKFLEKTTLMPASQDIPAPGLRHTVSKHRHRWIDAIHNVLSLITRRHLFRSPSHPGTSVRHHPDEKIPVTFRNRGMLWIKTGQPPLSSTRTNTDLLKADSRSLADQSILCIGGRAALYADYHRLIEAAGGHLMIFRSGTQNNTDCLHALLDRVNIVICPVDCINHMDFLAVRRYCQRTCKYCAMLQRSDLATFGKAVETLIRDNALPWKASETYLSNPCFPPLNSTGALAG